MDPLVGSTHSEYSVGRSAIGQGREPDRQAVGGGVLPATAASSKAIRFPDDQVTLSGKRPEVDPTVTAEKTDDRQLADAQNPLSEAKTTATGRTLDDPQVQAQIAQLKQTEEKVKAHEAAHKAAGGNLAGSASYSYTEGPDGRSYITGGEVQIDISDGRTPEETISRMQQVIRAALAPADPSAQDRAVAAQAAGRMTQAQQEKLEAESVAAKADPSRPDDPAGAALQPEETGAQVTSTEQATGNYGRAHNAYGNPAVQGSNQSGAAIKRQSGWSAAADFSLFSAVA